MSLDEITSASLSPNCMRCILDKFIDASPDDAPWRTKAGYMRSVLRTIADNSETMTAPEIGHELEALLERTYGIKLDLSTEKRHFNELVLGMEKRLRQRIRQSDEFVNRQPIQIFMVKFVQKVDPLKIPKKNAETTCKNIFFVI